MGLITLVGKKVENPILRIKCDQQCSLIMGRPVNSTRMNTIIPNSHYHCIGNGVNNCTAAIYAEDLNHL